MPGIEFLPGEGEDDSPATEPPARRAWWVLVVVAAVLGLGIWAFTRPDGTRRPNHAAPIAPTAAPALREQDACGGAPSCTITVDLPDAVTAAFRDRLHLRGVHYSFRRTELAGSFTGGPPALVHRIVVVTTARGSVQVIVQPHVPNGSDSDLHPATAIVRRVVPGYAVEVDYTRTGGGLVTASERAQLVALAQDRRLESVRPPG